MEKDIVLKITSNHTTICGAFQGNVKPFIRFGLSIITTPDVEMELFTGDSSYVFSTAFYADTYEP